MSEVTGQFRGGSSGVSLAGAGLSWLDEARRHALGEFEANGLPQQRDENWKYTSIRPIAKHQYVPPADERALSGADLEAFMFPGFKAHRLIFENGRLRRDLPAGEALPDGVTCRPLAEAFEANAEALAPFYDQTFSGSETGFAALNTAIGEDGLYVHVPTGVRVSAPLCLLYVSCAGEERVASHPRVIVHLERDSELVWVEDFVARETHGNLTNVMSQVRLDEGASLRHVRLQREAKKAFLVNRTDVEVDRSARYTSFAIDMGGRVVRHDLNVRLHEPGAECSLKGLYMLRGREHVDNHTRIDHAAPHTTSNEMYKGVFDGRSRGVFNGKVVVAEHCDKTNAAQSNPNLLLSPRAEIDTKPELEIYADDVKCTHGATTGQLDEDALFYLRARGLDLEAARALLTYGFCREVVDQLPVPAIGEGLAETVMERLPSGLALKEAV